MKTKDLVELLRYICSINASDLHITVGSPPRARVHGDLVNLEYDTLTKPIISLFELYSKSLISYNEALNASLNKDELKNMMDRIKINMRG
jgi:Tfp pilus assembly ATPase PilU